MDKSIMAMADDILGGALSNPSKAQSQLSNPYNEPELPELSDQLRESMMNQSTKHLEEEQTPEEVARKKKEWEEKNRERRKARRMARSVRGDRLERGEVARQKAHTQGRGQGKGSPQFRDTRQTTPSGDQATAKHWRTQAGLAKKRKATDVMNTPAGAKFAKRAHRSAINRMRQRRGAEPLAKEQVQILLQARDILREVTGVGGIGVGPQMTASRAYSTHGADMGKDTVKIEPVDKALRKTEKGKAKKKKKVKKESFELFLDAILNETQETK